MSPSSLEDVWDLRELRLGRSLRVRVADLRRSRALPWTGESPPSGSAGPFSVVRWCRIRGGVHLTREELPEAARGRLSGTVLVGPACASNGLPGRSLVAEGGR